MLPLTGLEFFSLTVLPIVAGVALDILGNREVQLFHHTNIDGFLLCPLEFGKCDPCCLPNHLELYTQHHRNPGRATRSTNKKQQQSYKTDPHWSESFREQQVGILSWQVSTLAHFLRKSELVSA